MATVTLTGIHKSYGKTPVIHGIDLDIAAGEFIAIVRDPAVFLFDEPLSNLDAKLRVQMRLEIKALQRKLGVTSLYVTHDQVEAMTLADRMVVMNAGVAEQIGSPLDVYERPATVFAAQFIGSPAMNVLAGKAAGRIVRLANGIEVVTGTEARGDVLLGVWPEHMERDPDGPLVLDVHRAEPLGANTLLHGRLAGIEQEIVVSLPGVHREDVMAGSARFRVPPAACHIFESATGRRLGR